MYIITGFGRSGTSLVSNIMLNLGFDMGVKDKSIDAGFEKFETAVINKAIMAGDTRMNKIDVENYSSMCSDLIVVKDPRFIITIGVWMEYLKDHIQHIFFCERDYDAIIDSSEKSFAGTMAMFNGWPRNKIKTIMKNIEEGFFDICDSNNITVDRIMYPKSTYEFRELRCLQKIGVKEKELKAAWCELVCKNLTAKKTV